MAVITPVPKTQFIGADGIPLVGGKVYTYAAGTTSPQVTYTDSSGATPNTNPIILDSRGEADIWLGEATYKFKLTDSNDVEQWTVDYISAPTTAVSPVLTGNVTISTDSSGPALKITQTGTGDVMRVQDSVDPDLTPFVINSAGLVGLGTVAPAEALDIDNNGKIQFSANGTPRTVISADASNSTFDVRDNRNFIVRTNGGNRLTISGAGAATFSGAVTFSGGIAITGNSTVTGTLGVSSTLTVSSGGLIVSAGGATITGNSTVTGTFGSTGALTVSAGGAAITGNSSITGTLGVSSTLTASNGLTVTTGGLTVSGGGAAITGNSTVTGTLGVSSALTVTTGGLTVSAGGATVTGNSSITGTLGVSSTLTASNGLTVSAGGATVTAGGLTVSAGGAAITGNSSVTGTLGVSSTLTASNGLTVSAGGATVTAGGLTVSAGGATITGNSSITGTLGVSSTLTVSAGGATITGNSSVTGTLTASSTLTASNGLTVSAGGATITGNSSVTGTFGVSSTLSVTGATSLTGNLSIISSTTERTITVGSSGGYFYGNATQIGWKDSGGVAKVYWDTSGNLTAAANVTAYSDARLKKNVTTITNALELVNKMRGVYYDRIDSGEAGVGVIAQEMQAVLPQVVKQNDDALSVAYGNVIGVLIEAIKELSAKVESR